MFVSVDRESVTNQYNKPVERVCVCVCVWGGGGGGGGGGDTQGATHI